MLIDHVNENTLIIITFQVLCAVYMSSSRNTVITSQPNLLIKKGTLFSQNDKSDQVTTTLKQKEMTLNQILIVIIIFLQHYQQQKLFFNE